MSEFAATRRKSYERINGFVSRLNADDGIHVESDAVGNFRNDDNLGNLGCKRHRGELPGEILSSTNPEANSEQSAVAHLTGNTADRLYAFLAYSQAHDLRTKQNSFLEAIIKRSNLSTGNWVILEYI